MSETKDILVIDEFIVTPRVQTGWGFLIALYFFFSGTGTGLFLVSLFLHSPLGVLIDMLFLAVGVLVLFIDLGSRWRFWKAFKKPMTSWISRGTFLITILFLFDAIYALIGFPPLSTPVRFFLGAIAVMVILYPGLVISYSPSITLWNSSFMPILFGLHSVTSGLSIGLLLVSSHSERWGGLMSVQFGLLLSLLIGMAIFVLVAHASTPVSKQSILLLLRGKAGFSFLLVVIGSGIVFPAILLLMVSKGLTSEGVVPVASILKLIGDLGFRSAILRIGLYDTFI